MKIIKSIFVLLLFTNISIQAQNVVKLNFKRTNPHKQTLNDLLNNLKMSNNPMAQEAYIKVYQFQKRAKLNEPYGVIIPKALVTTAVNNFDVNGPKEPIDKSNYNKWDFMVVYNGLNISNAGVETLQPVIVYYKGSLNAEGNMMPTGMPVIDISFPVGGGGDGKAAIPTPPPTLPNQ